jgi:hypothetical protein
MKCILNNDKKLLELTLKTWNSESNGMFDYSLYSVIEIKASIDKDTYVVLTKNNNFINVDQHSNIKTKDGDCLIFQVNNGNYNTYYLVNPIPKKLKLTETNFLYINTKMWLVIKKEGEDEDKNCNEDYYINLNDILKFGRVKYAVQKIYLKKEENSINADEPPIPSAELQYNISNLNKNKEPTFDFIFEVEKDCYDKGIYEKNANKNQIDYSTCDICRENKNNIIENDNDGDNFLISFCECEKVHFKCLKKKIKENIIYNERKKQCDYTILIKKFECPKCKIQYPLHFKLPNDDKIYNFIDIEEPSDCDYIILESIDYKIDESYCKSIHIIKFLKDYITIGRDSENDVIDTDISISRKHAILKYCKESGKICIENRSKKFGSLVLIKEPIKVLDKKIFLQVGRTYIECNLKNKEA